MKTIFSKIIIVCTFVICSLSGMEQKFTKTKARSYVIIDSITNHTQIPLTLKDGNLKIIDIPAGRTIQLTEKFTIYEEITNDTVYYSRIFMLTNSHSHAKLVVYQLPRKNRTLYGYTIYKETHGNLRKLAKRRQLIETLGQENHLSATIYGTTSIESMQVKLNIKFPIEKQIESEKE